MKILEIWFMKGARFLLFLVDLRLTLLIFRTLRATGLPWACCCCRFAADIVRRTSFMVLVFEITAHQIKALYTKSNLCGFSAGELPLKISTHSLRPPKVLWDILIWMIKIYKNQQHSNCNSPKLIDKWNKHLKLHSNWNQRKLLVTDLAQNSISQHRSVVIFIKQTYTSMDKANERYHLIMLLPASIHTATTYSNAPL